MRIKGRQLRFVAGTIGGWAATRGAMLWVAGGAGVGVGLLGGHLGLVGGLPWPEAMVAHPFEAAPRLGSRASRPSAPRVRTPATQPAGPSYSPFWTASDGPVERPPQFLHLAAMRFFADSPQAALWRARFDPAAPGDEAPLPSQALAAPARAAEASSARSRWSGQAYLFVRPGSGEASLAAGGQLGGSQAAARLAYQLNRDGPVRFAAAARLYAPLAAKGAEAAVGLDWHPLSAVPLRLSIERRVDLDGRGRHAWSAYAAGGFYREALDGRVTLDGYAQAGVVGVEHRDLFVDGALRAGRRWRLGPATLTAGAGLWGAAQPDVSRLDVGPRVAVAVSVQAHSVSLAVEGRFRAAGNARPGSGAAMTLALDL